LILFFHCYNEILAAATEQYLACLLLMLMLLWLLYICYMNTTLSFAPLSLLHHHCFLLLLLLLPPMLRISPDRTAICTSLRW